MSRFLKPRTNEDAVDGHSSTRVTGSQLCRLVLLMIVTSVSSFFGQTLRSPNSQVGHDFWGFKEGAPESVFALAQTSDRFLWLGTATGLFRFDGTRFELFHSFLGDQLLSTNVHALFASPSGGLWIGYAFGGFSFLKDGKVTNYGGETASATGSVRNFAQDKDGIVWAATTSGLWRFDHSHWQHIGPETSLAFGPFEEVRFDREGTLWALTGTVDSSAKTQLAYLRMGRRQFHIAESNLFFSGFTLDTDRHVVTSPGSTHLFDDTGTNAGDRPAAYPVFRKGCAQMVDRTGSVWIFPVQPGVLRLPASELPSDAVNKASPTKAETYHLNPYRFARLVDPEGNIWLGDQKGLHRFFYSPLTEQALSKSAERASAFAVTPDEDGAVWITAGNEEQLFNIYFVGHTQVKARKAPGPIVGFAYRARDKTTWFGGQAGLWHLVKGNLIRVDLPKEKANETYFLQTIAEDRSGGIWVSFGRHGLYRLADGVWTPYGGRQDLPKTGVVIEFTDSLGRVWFGYTKNTLAVLDGDRVQIFGPNDGLRVGNITAIYGRGSEIWIGGEFGLQQFDHGRFHDIRATNEQWLRGISGIVETANGDLWLNGLGGIFHVRRSELSEALRNSAYQVKGEHFGRREGVPGVAAQVRPLNTAVEGTDGRLWFTGSTGVVWLDPTRSEKKVPPPITIQSVSVDDKNYQLASAQKFPAHTASVQITFAAISLSDPETIRFRYKLQETDKDWHEVSAASPVSYHNLSPGSYHFSVNATDTNGVWSDAVASAEFTILPAFYQTGWFIALCVVSALAFLYLLYLLRVRQLARQYGMRLEERLSERTRIARELHDTFLQTVQGSRLVADDALEAPYEPARMRQAMEQLSTWLRRAVEEGRAALNSLRTSATETNDLAEGLRRATEECRMFSAMETSFSVEGDSKEMHPVVRDEIYRIGYEAIRNASAHSKASRLHVGLKYRQDLAISIGDNGVGIPESIINSDTDGHYGLQGMRERAARIGGKLRIVSSVDSGTEVSLVVPGGIAFRGTGSSGIE